MAFTADSTNKRTNVWSWDFLKWKIKSGLDCEKKGLGRLWATFDGGFFSCFGDQKNLQNFLENTTESALKSCIIAF